MTQLSSGTLRLRAGPDTLLIGHRAAFGYGRGLSRLESEDEVRRRLIQAMADGGALQSLRLFWGRLHFDTRNLTHTEDRILIDQVVAMTMRGPLAAYLVPDASVKHLVGSAVNEVRPHRPMLRAPSSVIGGAPSAGGTGFALPSPDVDAPFASGAPAVAMRGDEPTPSPLQVALMTVEQRVLEVMERTPRRMPAVLQEESAELFEEETLATIAQVLATWAGAHIVGVGFMIEALLLADGLVSTSSAAMEAAEELDEALELVRQARDERQLEEASELVAEAIQTLGVPAFLAAIWRGANRFTSESKR
jgi:hypothetical protein